MSKRQSNTGEIGVYEVRGRYVIQWCARGRRFRETLRRGVTEKEAISLRSRRVHEAEDGRAPAQPGRVTVAELFNFVSADYAVQRRRSVPKFDHVGEHFGATFDAETETWKGGAKATDVTYESLHAYVRSRQQERAADATIQQELAGLRRGFNLAIKAGRLAVRPATPTLRVQNARGGFFEEPSLVAVLDALRDLGHEHLAPVVEFAYCTGWRKEEVLRLTWDRVDFKAGVVRLEAGTTKNGEARAFPFAPVPRLAALLRDQRDRTTAVEVERRRVVPLVFHRAGQPIRDPYYCWRAAVERADLWVTRPVLGTDGKVTRTKVRPILHDLRRSAARNLRRAGVDEGTIMALCGWKTRAMFDRYNIVDDRDKRTAAERLAAYHAAEQAAAPKTVTLDLKRVLALGA